MVALLLKKIIFSLFFLYLFSFSAFAAGEPEISAQSAVVINAETKEIIYEKNAHTQRSMASTTKIMTSLIAIESGELGCVVTAENFAAEGTSIGLKDGYKLTLQDLVYGMLLESGNDAARLTANFLAGNEEKFAKLMNNKAKQIGMTSTNFVTASGLDSELHYSTAYDMALLGAYAVSNPTFKEICSTKRITVDFIEPKISYTYSNHNKLLSSCEGVFGIKTGFTKKSGRCLVSACERDGVTLVCVTLKAPNDWKDHSLLYDYCYNAVKKEKIEFGFPSSANVYGGKCKTISVDISEKNVFYSHKNSEKNVNIKIMFPRFVYAPVKIGDTIGEIRFYYDDTLFNSVSIVAKEGVDAIEEVTKVKFKEKFFNFLKNIFYVFQKGT